MESIEQLKLENEKLNARLNKAAEVFRTQKTQIEKLNIQLAEFDNTVLEYKDKINVLEKSLEQAKIQENNISVKDSEDYIKVVNENNSLKNRLNEVENVAVSLDNLKENHIKEIQGLNEQIDKSDKEIYNLDNLLNESRTNYDELKQKYEALYKTYETLTEKYKDLHETYNKTKNLYDEDIHKYTDLKDNYENLQNIHNKNLLEIEASHTNIAKLQKDHDDAVKTATAYQKSYEETKDQNAVLQEKLDKMTEEVQALEKERSNHKRIISEMESLKTGSEEIINGLTKDLESKNIELSQYKNKQQKYEEFVTTIFGISDSFRNNGNNIEETKQHDNPPLKSKIPVKPISTNNPFMSDAVGMNI